MVNFSFATALVALASLQVVIAAPGNTEAPGNVTYVERTQEEGIALAKIQTLKERSEPKPAPLDERQLPAFGVYWENWDFSGKSYYHRAPIDGRGHYIGDEWNGIISSIQNFDYDKKCIYWTEWSWDFGGYCYGQGRIFAGRYEEARLYDPFNDAISCMECSWN